MTSSTSEFLSYFAWSFGVKLPESRSAVVSGATPSICTAITHLELGITMQEFSGIERMESHTPLDSHPHSS